MKGGTTMPENLKQLQKMEALERLKILHKKFQTMNSIVREYERDNTIYYSEYQNKVFSGILYWVSNSEELSDVIKQFEGKHNSVVYHAILTPLTYGRMFSILYVSPHTEEWERDRKELAEGLPLAYCMNLDDSTTSEFGTIQIERSNGGITRVA